MSSASSEDLVGLFQTIISGGPALIFAIMWWLERTERKDLSNKLIQTLGSVDTMNKAWLRILNDKESSK